MTETTLTDWLPIAEAAARIGCSTRTVERLAAKKQLEQRLRPQAGSPAVAVFNPDDVDRIAAERHPAPPPFVLEAGRATGNGNGQGTARVGNDLLRKRNDLLRAADDPIRQLAALVLHALQSPPLPPVSEKVAETRLFLTLAEAAAYTGLSTWYLRVQIKKGTLPAVRTRGWRIRRKDLEVL